MTDYDNNTTVTLAISSLRQGVDRIVERRRSNDEHGDHEERIRRVEQRIHIVVGHMHHLLLDLDSKRRTLKSFLQWNQQEWQRLVKVLERYPIPILGHTLQLFIRCQDGLMMLTSGECRHEYDVRQAQQQQQRRGKYASRLGTLRERSDGYTCLYKADAVYSGCGWDEYANETVGLRARLIHELKRLGSKNPWGALERQGRTELLESILSQHEVDMEELQQGLQNWKRQIVADIQDRLRPKNLKFVSQDKMERLSLVHGTQTLEFERRADSFQIDGPLLPREKQRPEDWNSLALNLDDRLPDGGNKSNKGGNVDVSSKPKKRRTIVDSDSEDDTMDVHQDENPVKHQRKPEKKKKPTNTTAPSNNENKVTGLRVRVGNTGGGVDDHPVHSSIAAIKAGMGVDTNQLETARETLELETAAGSSDTISREERDLLSRERILKRVQSRQIIDDDEVWDAREYLRQACMAAGNFFLWEQPNYGRSIECFERAKSLTLEQQKAHETAVKTTNDDTTESCITQRNIIYLLGQATVNVGIAMVVSSEGDNNRLRRNSRRVLHELETARTLTGKILEMTNTNNDDDRRRQKRFSISIEDVYDALKARGLDCLASRWMGDVLWAMSQETLAIEMLEYASGVYSEYNNMDLKGCELADITDLATECIYSADKLAELAYSRMKQLSVSSSSWERGDELLATLKKSLKRHIEIYQSIEELGGAFDPDDEISSPQDTTASLQDIVAWWNNVKNGTHAKTAPVQANNTISISRPDLSSIPAPDLLSGASSHFGFHECRGPASGNGSGERNGSHRRHSHSFGKSNGSRGASVGRYGSASINAAVAPISISTTPPVVYRKWGDDLVKERNQGTLPYPTAAPPIPPEFQALLDMKKVTIASGKQ